MRIFLILKQLILTKLFFCTGCLILFSILAVKAANPYQGADNALKIETLAQGGASWDKVPYTAYPSGMPQLTVLKITFPPNANLPWHLHSIPVAGYLLSGRLIIETKSGQKKVLNAGEACLESMNEVHRGTTGNEPAVIIVFYAGAPGVPLAQQVEK